MCTLLIVFLLAGTEAGQPDSVQYCGNARASWRVLTHAGTAAEITPVETTIEDIEALAEAKVRAEFGSAVQRKLTIVGADDSIALLAALQRHGLRGRVVTDDARGLAYWRGADAR